MSKNFIKLSVVLATRNEEMNIARCLKSIKDIADEIIVVDEYSKDKTREIARSLGAKVFLEPHHDNFHVTKQKALDLATGEWILQMDADEVVTPELSDDIKKVVNGRTPSYKAKLARLFQKHIRNYEKQKGKLGNSDKKVVAYLIPRLNMFLGKPLIHAGVYPDPAVRLVKNGKARFPVKSVHENMEIDGSVGCLYTDIRHYDSPTLKRYLWRLNRYTDLQAGELSKSKVGKNIFQFFLFTIYHPLRVFFSLYFRHLGFIDGVNGFLWSFFSASHFPIAYFKYLTNNN